MKKHLGPEELVDLVEGGGSSAARAHVAICDGCRTQLDELRAAMKLAAEVDVPEPSPLFWDHLSARVRERIAEEPAIGDRRAWSWRGILGAHGAPASRGGTERSGAQGPPRATEPGSGAEPRLSLRWVLPIALAFGVLVLFVSRLTVNPPTPIASEAEFGSPAAAAIEDSSWTVLASMTEELSWDEVADAGLAVAPGAADRAVAQLTLEEQQELVRLLRAEIGVKGT